MFVAGIVGDLTIQTPGSTVTVPKPGGGFDRYKGILLAKRMRTVLKSKRLPLKWEI